MKIHGGDIDANNASILGDRETHNIGMSYMKLDDDNDDDDHHHHHGGDDDTGT